MTEQLFRGDRAANTLYRKAESARQAGDWQTALRLAVDLLHERLLRGSDLEVGDRVLIERVADLAVPFGLSDAADDLLAGLAGEHASAGRTFARDYVVLKRLHLALAADRLQQALEHLQSLQPRIGPLPEVPYRAGELPAWEARVQWDGPPGRLDRSLFFARLYLSMGQWLSAQGQYGHAAVLMERGRAHAVPPASSLACRSWLPLQLALAEVLLEQGRLDECGEVLNEVRPRLDDSSPAWSVQWLERSGQRHLLLGEYGPALERFSEVVHRCADGGFERATLAALLAQVPVLLLVNQVSLAKDTLAKAARLADGLGDAAAASRIAWLLRLAEARGRTLVPSAGLGAVVQMQAEDFPREPAAAPEEQARPDDPDGQPANFLAFFEDRALSVQWALATGHIDEADRRCTAMHQVFGSCESPLIRLRLHLLAGMVAYDAGEYPDAERIFSEACPHLERLKLQPDLWQATRFLGWCATRQHAPAPRQQELAARAQRQLDRLADSFPSEQRAQYLLNKWTVEEKELLREVKELVEMRQVAQSAPWWKRPLRWWRLWQRLHDFLVRIDDNRRRLAASRSADGSTAQSRSLLGRLWRHPGDAATVSFLALPDQVFVARGGWLSLDFAVAPLGRVRLRALVADWHRAVSEWRGHREYRRETQALAVLSRQAGLAGELSEGLRLPHMLAGLPRRVRRLTVVADDALHGFPFAALPMDNKAPLIEKYALTMSYDRTASFQEAADPPSTGMVFAVSRPATVQLGGDEFEAGELKKVIPEAEEVAAWLAARGLTVTRLIDGDATRMALAREWESAGMIHAACHGVFRPDRPDESGLVLVPEPGRSELFSLRDFGRLDLRRLHHVTLSSCWGADNFVLPGRWIVSLPETLCRRGAGSVLASLWEVDDEVALAFSRRFYDLLARLPRDAALQQAQLECRENRLLKGGRQTDHPFYWAGYRLHGRGDRLLLPCSPDNGSIDPVLGQQAKSAGSVAAAQRIQ